MSEHSWPRGSWGKGDSRAPESGAGPGAHWSGPVWAGPGHTRSSHGARRSGVGAAAGQPGAYGLHACSGLGSAGRGLTPEALTHVIFKSLNTSHSVAVAFS